MKKQEPPVLCSGLSGVFACLGCRLAGGICIPFDRFICCGIPIQGLAEAQSRRKPLPVLSPLFPLCFPDCKEGFGCIAAFA